MPDHPAPGDQWWQIDWCVRSRPSLWLDAAGLGAHAYELARRPAVGCPQDLVALWPTLTAAAHAARASREAAWQAVAAARDQASHTGRDHIWGALADAAWVDAVAGAGHLLRTVAQAAGLDPTAAMLRTIALPDTAGTGWDVAWDTAADAACTAVWRAVGAVTGPKADIWATTPARAWEDAHSTATNTVTPVMAALESAHRHPHTRDR